MESYINIDKNMIVNTTIGDAEVVWMDVQKEPFSLSCIRTLDSFKIWHERYLSALLEKGYIENYNNLKS